MNGMNVPNWYLDYLIEPSFQGVNRCFVLPFNALGDRAGHSRWKKPNFMAPVYGWGSTASRLMPLWGDNLLFTAKFPDIPGTYLIDLGRMKGWVNLGATQWFWAWYPWIGNPVP